jgi:hypothetical protein
MLRKVLLVCGILVPLVWVAGDIIASLRYPGYSWLDYSVSELSAIGAPTRTAVTMVGVVSSLLEAAFAVGIWLCAGGKRGLRIAAGLMFAHAGLNLAIPVVNLVTPFATMHTREELAAGGSSAASDTMHLVYVVVTVLLIFLMIGFASGAFGKVWRWYSIGTIVVALAFGAWAGRFAPAVEANLPTPGLGLIERVNVYGFYLWLALLAVMLLRAERAAPLETPGAGGVAGPVGPQPV